MEYFQKFCTAGPFSPLSLSHTPPHFFALACLCPPPGVYIDAPQTPHSTTMERIQRQRLVFVVVAVIMAISIGGGTTLFSSSSQPAAATASLTNGDITYDMRYELGSSELYSRVFDADADTYDTETLGFPGDGEDAAKHLCIDDTAGANKHEDYGFTSRSDCLDYFDKVESMHKTALAALDVLKVGWALMILSLVLYKLKDNKLAKALAVTPSVIVFVGFGLALGACHMGEFTPDAGIIAYSVIGILSAFVDGVVIFFPDWANGVSESAFGTSVKAGGYSGAV